MTTITIEIPDSDKSILSTISDIAKGAGLNMHIDTDSEGLSKDEFELLAESYKEALLIRDGKLKGMPVSKLWND